MFRVEVKSELLCWARERSGLNPADLRSKFPKIDAWERGELKPTLKQLEDFAKAVHVPTGYLFLPEPPVECIPVPDLRTIRRREIRHPSPDLLDTIYLMQRRQAWLREEVLDGGADPLEFVGTARVTDDPESVGREMRRMVGLEASWIRSIRTWKEAVSALRRAMEALGVMAVINGVVGNDTHRKLNVQEFRGFALSDAYAPLVFVNGADARSAQMFTLAHELAHIWLGESGLTDVGLVSEPSQDIESWCDRAGAEFLVPAMELKSCWRDERREEAAFEILARRFKVSPIVIGRRAMDLKLVSRERFFNFYKESTAREINGNLSSGRGDFFRNQNSRVGEMFALQVIRAAMEGRLSFKNAYSLTGLRGGTFQKYAHRLGFDLP